MMNQPSQTIFARRWLTGTVVSRTAWIATSSRKLGSCVVLPMAPRADRHETTSVSSSECLERHILLLNSRSSTGPRVRDGVIFSTGSTALSRANMLLDVRSASCAGLAGEARSLADYVRLPKHAAQLVCITNSSGDVVTMPSAVAPANVSFDTHHGRPTQTPAEPIALLHMLLTCTNSASSNPPVGLTWSRRRIDKLMK